jgi:uncharacterized membrane protein
MATRPTTTRTTRRKDAETTSAEQEADSPIIPVEQLERLNLFKPSAVDWVIKQTQTEAEFRRRETSRVNKYILVEHLVGQIFALIIGMVGVISGSIVAYNGQQVAGAVIASIAIAGLIIVFLTGRKKSS